MAMQRKPAPHKSLDKRLGIVGTLSFMAAALAVIPIIVLVLFAVAYMPFGVALLLVAGYLTRRRWTPSLRRRAQAYLNVPEMTSVLRERAEPLRLSPVRVHVESESEPPSGASADLRNTREL